MINPYELLGVDIHTSLTEIKKAYYALALMVHPDRGGNDTDMSVLHDAYKYVYEQISHAQEKNQRSVEELEALFKDFCSTQEHQKPYPSFQDIFEECVFDNTKFIRQFNIESTASASNVEIFPAALPGGYAPMLDTSEYQNQPFKEYTMEHVQNQHPFDALQVARNDGLPDAGGALVSTAVCADVPGYGTKPVANYTVETVIDMPMTDYKIAYAPTVPPVIDANMESRPTTLEDLFALRNQQDNTIVESLRESCVALGGRQ